jgi:hypothetical protein
VFRYPVINTAATAVPAIRVTAAARAAAFEASGILAETIFRDGDAARRHYQTALHFAPHSASVLFRLGNSLEIHAHDFQAALECFDGAAAIERMQRPQPERSRQAAPLPLVGAARRAALLRDRIAFGESMR